MMPVFLFWAVPAAIVVGGIGYYLIAIAAVVDACSSYPGKEAAGTATEL